MGIAVRIVAYGPEASSTLSRPERTLRSTCSCLRERRSAAGAGSALGLRTPRAGLEPALRPSGHGVDRGGQSPPLFRQRVFDADWRGREDRTLHDSFLFQLLQSLTQHPRSEEHTSELQSL